MIAPAGSSVQQWALTSKGKTTLASAERFLPEEVTLSIYHDGLLRKPVRNETASLMKPRDVKNADFMQIAPIPPHAPLVDELTVSDVNDFLRASMRRGGTRKDLLVVKSILKADLLFQYAIMLVFQSLTGLEVQVSFVVDGVASPVHDRAFAAGDGPSTSGVAQNSGRRTAEDIARALLDEDLLPDLSDLRRAEELAKQLRDTRAAENAEAQLGQVTEDPGVAAAARDARKSSEDVATSLRDLSVSLVEMYEHRGLLESALHDSRTRLMINSPWITGRAVNNFFLRELERRLKGGLHVYIAYGLGDSKDESQADPHTISALRALSHRYAKLFKFTRLGDTHAKVLISDSSFMVVTSFNWLSFRGDPDFFSACPYPGT